MKTKTIDKDTVIEDLRVYIAVNFKRQTNFAKHVGVTDPLVSAVLNGSKPIPKGWLDFIGYKQISVYVKK